MLSFSPSIRQSLFLTSFFVLVGFSTPTHAEVARGKISTIGCHLGDNTCYLTIKGYKSMYCSSSSWAGESVRWSTDTPAGRRAHAMLYAAYLSGSTVRLQMDTKKCFALTYPTFVWLQVE